MTPEERKATLASLLKLCPDPVAFHRCKRFKFHTATQSTSVEAEPQSSATASPLPARKDLERLKGSFTEEELFSLSGKSAALLHSDAIRTGFQQGTFLVNSRRPPPNCAPYTVTCFKSGKCSWRCKFYGHNNVCQHTIAVAWKLGVLSRALENFKGRSTDSISMATVSSAVGNKAPASRRRTKEFEEPKQTGSEYLDVSNALCSKQLCVKSVNPTTVVITKAVRPENPPPPENLWQHPKVCGLL